MKKTLLATLLLSSLAVLPVKAAQFWYDVATNYPVGGLTTNTAAWFPHQPGSLTAHDTLIVSNNYTSGAAVNGRRLRVNGLNTEYIMRLFDQAGTNITSSGAIYASFIANANFVPNAGVGTYFATFNDLGANPVPGGYNLQTNGFNFRGRVFEIGNTNVFPFTNRLGSTFSYGVANAANDPASGGLPSTLFVPIDLIKNVDYQVVLKYDLDAGTATLWVNPASESDTLNMAGPTSDLGAIPFGLAGLLFRQRVAGGTVDVRDVVVGDTFADVMTNTAATSPVLVATNFNGVASYTGSPALLEVFATSIGGGPLSYQWYQIAGGVTNAVGGNSQTYVVTSLSGGDQGAYFCAVTNAAGVGAVSRTNYFISVNTTPTAPGFTIQPKNTTASVGATVSLTCTPIGTGPLSFQWFFNANPITDGANPFGFTADVCVYSGSQTPTLVLTGVSTNEAANYSVRVTGAVAPPATSTNAALTVLPPQVKSIAFLRSLLSKTTWLPTDTSSTFSITGVVTTTTNLTSGNTSSYYLQDSTDGINLFITGDSSFRPNRGDLVTATGTLSSFLNSLELACNALNVYQTYSVVSHGNPLPAPSVFNLTFTNNAGLMETNYEGRFVMLTNVFFPPGNFPNGASVNVTSQNGAPFAIFVSAQCTAVVGQPMPSFAWSVLGAMSQNLSGGYSSAAYNLNLTDLGDVITSAPPPVTATIATSGNNVSLTWTAVPYNYSYSVLGATNIAGPYLPVASGLTFATSAGTYTDTNGISGAKFYRVTSP